METIEIRDSVIGYNVRDDSRRVSLDKIAMGDDKSFAEALSELHEKIPDNYRVCVLLPEDNKSEKITNTLFWKGYLKEVLGLNIFTAKGISVTGGIWSYFPSHKPEEIHTERARVNKIITEYSPEELDKEKTEFLESLQKKIVTRNSSDLSGDIEKILEVLHKKLGSNGEKWYDRKEITHDWIRKTIAEGANFIYVVDKEKVVGAASILPLTDSIVNVKIKGYNTNLDGWEPSHFVVLGKGEGVNGKYAGLAQIMNSRLLNQVSQQETPFIILDGNFETKKQDGGSAWKLGPKFGWQPCLGTCLHYTGMMADPERQDYKGNNHLVWFQSRKK